MRDALHSLREELAQTLSSSADAATPVNLDEPIGRLSRMDAMQVQAMAEAQERRRRCERVRIEQALDRLADGEYGYCA